MPVALADRTSIRRQLRCARSALSPGERITAAFALHDIVTHTRLFRSSKRIAYYFAFDSEIDPDPIARTAHLLGKQLFLPVIGSGKRMRFARADASVPLSLNRFGIPEPAPGFRRYLNPRWLDLVVTPLVAFDQRGYRLGLGGGYYDACFAFLRQRDSWIKPKLLGIGYDFQRVEKIDAEQWDVPLWCIATDCAIYTNHENCL
ncbi:MAG: 5-formyltetrahydrofolate cyclo-ligase [Gammaproteobacteria bacterium]